MGRPREHDEATRASLRAAAERLVARGGPDALSVRAAADEAGTTTRAVYSLFGSKDGLVAALAQQAFEYLEAGVDALPDTDDLEGDLIGIGTRVFRVLVREHPSLYRIAFQRIVPGLRAEPDLAAARARAFASLQTKVRRAKEAGLLGRKSVLEAAIELNAMFEGLANAELRGSVLPLFPPGGEERAWRDALRTVVRGFSAPARQRAHRDRPPSRRR
jgi:AcrR family transcriptional regulator